MRKATHGVTALGELATGEVIAGDERGNVTSLNRSDKAVWKFKSGGEISNIFVIGEYLIVTSHDNFVYSLHARDGDVIWKKRLTGRVSEIANIADRYVLTTNFNDRSAVLVEVAKGKAVGQMVFEEDENLVYEPLSTNALIFALTNRAVHAYSLNGCASNIESGPGK